MTIIKHRVEEKDWGLLIPVSTFITHPYSILSHCYDPYHPYGLSPLLTICILQSCGPYILLSQKSTVWHFIWIVTAHVYWTTLLLRSLREIDACGDTLIGSKFYWTGQRCTCSKIIMIQYSQVLLYTALYLLNFKSQCWSSGCAAKSL